METNGVVLITGVSRKEGIGFGLAKSFAERGFSVIITARDLSKAAVLAAVDLSRNGGKVYPLQTDITDEESVSRGCRWVGENFGKLDILINNAGGGYDYGIGPLNTDFEAARQALETNLFGTWRMIRYYTPLLKKSTHPRIVNISSGAGSFSHPVFGLAVHPALMTSYGISKLALNGLTIQVARELKPAGIKVNAVNPGFVATAEGMEAAGARPVSESVAGIMWAATLPDDGPTGGFFEDRKEIPW